MAEMPHNEASALKLARFILARLNDDSVPLEDVPHA
jgi:hypothetical protein